MTAQTSKASIHAFTVTDITQIVEAFRKSGFNRLDLKYGSTKLSLSQPTSGDKTAIEGDDTFDVVVSPSVGFFHDVDHSETSAEQDHAVTGETILGIVKTLNNETEVLAGLSGEIATKLANEGDFVAYGQPLFYIRPDSRNIPSDHGLKAGSNSQ